MKCICSSVTNIQGGNWQALTLMATYSLANFPRKELLDLGSKDFLAIEDDSPQIKKVKLQNKHIFYEQMQGTF